MTKLNLNLPKAKTSAVAVSIKHPETGEDLVINGKEVKVHVYGKASKVQRDFQDAKIKAYASNKSKNKNDLNMDKIRKDAIEYAVACTEKIENLASEDITSKEDLEEIYSNVEYYWFLDQVTAAIESDTNFF